jgi:hypothetical protein
VASILRAMLSAPAPDDQEALGAEPEMPIRSWVYHLLRRSQIPRETPLVATLYLDRVRRRQPALTYTRYNIYRNFLVALIVASKVMEDNTYRMGDWQMIAREHYPSALICRMELEFLSLLGFDLVVSVPELIALIRATFALQPAEPGVAALPAALPENWYDSYKREITAAEKELGADSQRLL